MLSLLMYGSVAAIVFLVSVATTPPPRSTVLVGLAALLWPLTMSVVAIQAYCARSQARVRVRPGSVTGLGAADAFVLRKGQWIQDSASVDHQRIPAQYFQKAGEP